MIDWDWLESRQPSARDIAKAIKAVKKLPDAGDGDHVMAPWPKASEVPATQKADWASADIKQVKIKKLKATTMRLDRNNLIWHLQHPGKSRYKGLHNTHPQIVATSDDGKVIVDGHHRLAALLMLGIKKESAWVLQHKDIG